MLEQRGHASARSGVCESEPERMGQGSFPGRGNSTGKALGSGTNMGGQGSVGGLAGTD